MFKGLFVLFLAATAAGAVTIQFTALPPNYQYGTYNGFVLGTIDGQPNLPLIGDDFYHTTYVPSGAITFSVSTLTGAKALQFARFVDLGDWPGSNNQWPARN